MHRHFDPVTLRVFVAVCEERNIARAAARESLVPSAVSKRVGALEARLGTPLLVRGRRGIEPTDAGQTLLRQARDVLGVMARMHVELEAFAGGVQGSVRVVATLSALAESLPDDVAAFMSRHTSLRISLDERLSLDVVRDVREGAADVGVVWDIVDADGLVATRYRADRLVVLMSATHPLAQQDQVRFAETLAYPSVGVSATGAVGVLMRRQAALSGQTLTHRMQVSSLDAGVRIVAAGLGLAILPYEVIVSRAASLRLTTRPLSEPWAQRRFVILTRDDAWLSGATRQLVAHLRECAAPAVLQAEPSATRPLPEVLKVRTARPAPDSATVPSATRRAKRGRSGRA